MQDEAELDIIAGGGLAGYFLAANLVNAGRRVMLFRDKDKPGASAVAAGLVNPVTGRQYAVSWKAPEFLDALEAFFQIPLFRPLGKYFHELPVYRPFPDIYSANEWAGKSGWTIFNGLAESAFTPWHPEWILNPFGGMLHHRSGWLDIPPFLSALNEILTETGKFQSKSSRLKPGSIDPLNQRVEQDGITIPFRSLTFCEGTQATENPFFPISLIPLKGQVLTVESAGNPDRILSSGVFLLPLAAGKYRLGSTYERSFSNDHPDEAGKAELIEEVARWWIPPIRSVLQHNAGLRPTTADRMPIMGRHREYPALWIFNGLGAKGVMQGPALASLLANAILQQEDALIWKETHFSRKRAQKA